MCLCTVHGIATISKLLPARTSFICRLKNIYQTENEKLAKNILDFCKFIKNDWRPQYKGKKKSKQPQPGACIGVPFAILIILCTLSALSGPQYGFWWVQVRKMDEKKTWFSSPSNVEVHGVCVCVRVCGASKCKHSLYRNNLTLEFSNATTNQFIKKIYANKY